jgi:dihydroorotate dehydrogenase electron transfer subunit
MEQRTVIITKTEHLSTDIVRLTFHAPTIAACASPGQFVNIKTGLGFDPLLRRPLSIHHVSEDGHVQVIFKILGKGTNALAELKQGQSLNIVGPLGNHFKTGEAAVCLIGGGLGIAPLFFLAKTILAKNETSKLKIILAARNKTELSSFTPDFEYLGVTLHLATDDGSLGHHGLVTEIIPSVLSEPIKWQVCTCGPQPMMRAVAAICRKYRWSCQVSLETMMACGISACLGCAVASSGTDSKGPKYLHVCQDGPIFWESDIQWT